MWTDGFNKSTDHWLTPSLLTTHLSLKVYLLLLKRVFTSGTQLLHSNCCRNILFTVWRNSLIILILSASVNWGINEIKSVIFSWSCDPTWTHTRKIKHAFFFFFFFSKSTIFFYLHLFCKKKIIWKKKYMECILRFTREAKLQDIKTCFREYILNEVPLAILVFNIS